MQSRLTLPAPLARLTQILDAVGTKTSRDDHPANQNRHRPINQLDSAPEGPRADSHHDLQESLSPASRQASPAKGAGRP